MSIDHAAATEAPASTQRRIQRIRHELRRRELQVLRVQRISPHFASITFGGESLADFASAGFDDHVKFMLDGPPGTEPVRRDYTPRRFSTAARELTIEFALHGHGPAAAWAAQAAPGMAATIGGPRGSMVVPTDYDWHLLAGDAAALPAIHRRLEELPAGTRAIVRLQVEAADRRALHSAAALDLQWLDSPEALLQSLQALALPAGEGFAWAGGEATLMARVRDLLLRDKGHPKEAARISAYWRAGAAGFHEDL